MISLSIEGISDAVETLREVISPWRRENARRKADLENAMRQAEIQRLNADVLLTRARAEREKAAASLDSAQATLLLSQARKLEAEAQQAYAEAEKIRAGVERERLALLQSKIELATRIVERYLPNANGSQKIGYIVRLLPILDKLISTDIELIE